MSTVEAYTGQGVAVRLRPIGKEGGEGAIYAVEGTTPPMAAKLYQAGYATPELHDKVRAMADNPPFGPAARDEQKWSIAWPGKVLYSDRIRTRFAGFTMPMIDVSRYKPSHLFYGRADRNREFAGQFTWRHLLGTAHKLASAVASVHRAGHRVGDLREANLLVSPETNVTLVDCDSFEVTDAASGRTFHTRVGTAEYLPPELQDANFRADDHPRHHGDLFALGVLVFQFLMDGFHPFASVGAAVENAHGTSDKIRLGHFAWPGDVPGLAPPPAAYSYFIVPPRVRGLFQRCFTTGLRIPQVRPAAQEWADVLRAEIDALEYCDKSDFHWFGRHSGDCPWCALVAQGRPDPYSGRVEPPRRPAAAPQPAPQGVAQPAFLPAQPQPARQPAAAAAPAPVPVPVPVPAPAPATPVLKIRVHFAAVKLGEVDPASPARVNVWCDTDGGGDLEVRPVLPPGSWLTAGRPTVTLRSSKLYGGYEPLTFTLRCPPGTALGVTFTEALTIEAATAAGVNPQKVTVTFTTARMPSARVRHALAVAAIVTFAALPLLAACLMPGPGPRWARWLAGGLACAAAGAGRLLVCRVHRYRADADAVPFLWAKAAAPVVFLWVDWVLDGLVNLLRGLTPALDEGSVNFRWFLGVVMGGLLGTLLVVPPAARPEWNGGRTGARAKWRIAGFVAGAALAWPWNALTASPTAWLALPGLAALACLVRTAAERQDGGPVTLSVRRARRLAVVGVSAAVGLLAAVAWLAADAGLFGA